MALTPEEKKKVLKTLDDLDRSTLEKILASLHAFGRWLEDTLYDIFIKIKNALQSLWQSICNFFS